MGQSSLITHPQVQEGWDRALHPSKSPPADSLLLQHVPTQQGSIYSPQPLILDRSNQNKRRQTLCTCHSLAPSPYQALFLCQLPQLHQNLLNHPGTTVLGCSPTEAVAVLLLRTVLPEGLRPCTVRDKVRVQPPAPVWASALGHSSSFEEVLFTVLALVPPCSLEWLSTLPPSPGRAVTPQAEDFILLSFKYPEVPKVLSSLGDPSTSKTSLWTHLARLSGFWQALALHSMHWGTEKHISWENQGSATGLGSTGVEMSSNTHNIAAHPQAFPQLLAHSFLPSLNSV